MSKTIGVIGLGSIGMRHAKNLLAMGQKVWGYDPDLSIPGVPGIIRSSGLRVVIEKSEALVIASPTNRHHSNLLDMVDAGLAIFIEKPIADGIYDIPEWVDQINMVGNNLRFHSCVKAAREEMKTIGKPLWASFTISQLNNKYTDPCILNWGAHEIDLALHLLGPATVTAAAGDDKCMDVLLLHEYGVPSHIHVDYLAPIERRGFCILGTKANMSADLVTRTFILRGTNIDLVQPLGGSFDQDYKDEMQAFIDLIDGKPVPHAATGQDGLNTLELILEAQKMARM